MNAEYLCPVLTFFKENGRIDYENMHRLYDRLINAGMDGIIVLGSSGEFYSLSDSECEELGKDALAYINRRIPVYIGTGRTTLKETISFSNQMIACGADGVILISPYYIGASEEGFYEYFHQAASGILGNILIYNYPDRTGYDISIPVLKRLLKNHKNIIGIKDTAESATHTQSIIKALRPDYPDFKIYSGYDNNFLPVVMAGGNGCIAAISNADPRLCADWVRSVKQADFSAAADIHKKIVAMMDIYSVTTPFMPAMKQMLILLGLNSSDTCRLPALSVSEEDTAKIRNILERYYSM